MEKLRRARLWLMVGTPGSGKSTWIKNHKNFFADDVAVISRDAIRFSLLNEEEEYFSREDEVWREFVRQAALSLDTNVDTILDATHLNEASRGKILRALKDHLKDVEINAIVINSDLETCLERNEMREGRSYVPRGVIRRMASQFTIPTLEEGFDHIYIYKEEDGKVKYQIMEKE